MTGDVNFRGFLELHLQRTTLAVVDRAREDPCSVVDAMKVLLFDPRRRFRVVPPFAPTPQHLEKTSIDPRKDSGTARMTMIERPTPDLEIESVDQFARRVRTRFSEDRCAKLGQKTCDTFAGRFGKNLPTPIASQILAQEVEAVCDMRDSGLLAGEFKTPPFEESFYERLDFIFK